MPNVLWWGRTERDYSRNRIVLKLFAELGWDVGFYHPLSSHLGLLESFFLRFEQPDLLWVSCFRHRDIHSAAYWASKWNVPLILDPLISAYQKEVFEREKWPVHSRAAERRLKWEIRLFSKGDLVISDTPAHRDFFHQILKVPLEKLSVLYVSAEPEIFEPVPVPPPKPPYEVLFYGSFLELHGVDVIINAAKMLQNPNVRWVILGDGSIKKDLQREAHGCPNIIFEPWIAYEHLSSRMAQAHILLGIFGGTVLSDLVIPNKMFQSMAMGRPVITSYSKAYRGTLEGNDIIGWVPAGNPMALANKVDSWLQSPERLAFIGRETRKLFDTYFGKDVMEKMLKQTLRKVIKTH